MKPTIKKIIVLTMLLFICRTVFAQTPNWQQVTQAGGNDWDVGYSLTTDDIGNTYVIGIFEGTATFGSYSLTSYGLQDIFVAKMDPNGNWIWANQANGLGWNSATGVVTDNVGNVYVTGHFLETTTFGQYSLTSNGGSDIFVAKLDINGEWSWVTQAGGILDDSGYCLSKDDFENIYLVGHFQETATYGTYSLTSNGGEDIFVAQLSPIGEWVWVTNAGGNITDYGLGISTTNEGIVYITGEFRSTATFGTNSLVSDDYGDIYVAKLDSNGNWIWATQAGGIGLDRSYGITLDNAENIYVAGHFQETATYGTNSLTSNGGDDIFVAQLSSSGEWNWATNAGSIDDDRGFDMIIDNDGNNYITGHFQETAIFGSDSVASNGLLDIFLAKITSDGNWFWVTQAGGSDVDSGYGVTMNDTGSIYLTGEFSDIANFGTLSLTSYGTSDIFVAKLNNSNSIENCTIITQCDLSNYPNPFNPTTTISFSIFKESIIDLSIFNIKGHKIKSVVKRSFEAGNHSVIWNGDDDSGNSVSSGIYFYKLNVNGKTKAVRRCLLLK